MILIDSGVIGNYILTQFAQSYNVLTVKKLQPYAFTVINGANLGNSQGKINTETIGLPIIIRKYYKEITFDIIGLANYHIVLGIP